MNVYIFLTHNLAEGGIENGYFKILKSLDSTEKGIAIIRKGSHISECFAEDMKKCEVIYFDPSDSDWSKKVILDICPNDHVVMFSANMIDIAYLSRIKRNYAAFNIDLLYWVPHFTGKMVFFERWFPSVLRPIIRLFLRNLYMKMDKNNSICYGNTTHLDAFINNYKYKISGNATDKIWSIKGNSISLKKADIVRKSERNPFRIITIGRLNFPHKGYIIGLLKTYIELYKKYKNLELIVVGEGPDQGQLIDIIKTCDDECQQSIKMLGAVRYEDLAGILAQCHLNVGVAATVADGAKNGVLTITARHYCNDCECYGFYYDEPNRRLSCEPGEPVKDYIIQAIEMSDDEFIENSYKCYTTQQSMIEAKKYDSFADNVFNFNNEKKSFVLPRVYEWFFMAGAELANDKLKRKNHTDL